MSRGVSRAPKGPSPLRKLRILLAAGFFTSLVLVFLDIQNAVPKPVYDIGVYFQFLPSIIHGLRDFGPTAGGFILVLVTTLIFGRFYCSAVCPLGILMDIMVFFKRKTGRPLVHHYAPPRNLLRYGILAGTVLSLISGSMVIIDLLDPFSNFGRMAVALARPLAVLGNNGAAFALEMMGSYGLPPLSLKGVHAGIIAAALGFAVLVAGFALTRGRLYCNMICPVGSFLGLCARAAPVKIKIITQDCIECRKCEQACKSDCINIKPDIRADIRADSGAIRIDQSRCVVCFNCLVACPTGAIVYTPSSPTPLAGGHPTHTRREFLLTMGTALAVFPRTSPGAEQIRVTVPNTIPVPPISHPILPPGSLSLDRFTATCTACHACVARCPSHVLQPAITQYGLAGLFMPFLDPGTGFCTLNCNICGQVCPTRAITPFSLEEKKGIQTGVVKFIRDNCIVVLQKTDCGACAEHCPTKAVIMVKEGKLRLPKINEKICLGCGACEHVCPAKPNKAIYVQPHTVHQRAEAPTPSRPELVQPKGGDGFNF